MYREQEARYPSAMRYYAGMESNGAVPYIYGVADSHDDYQQ
ncbi:hypothetical protein SALBM311S_06163 [Streptomyces alboniger]